MLDARRSNSELECEHLYDETAQNVVGGTLRAAGLAKMAIKLAEGSGMRNQWMNPTQTWCVTHTLPHILVCVPDRRQHTVLSTGGGDYSG
jgi:hypothetical protein